MKNALWEFIDEKASFASVGAPLVRTLYFPLCNPSPFMSSVSPDLHGDIKTDFNSFLMEPVSRLSLVNSRVSRNFWVRTRSGTAWSATGVSKDPCGIQKYDEPSIEAGLLWHTRSTRNKKIGLSCKITSFVPASGEPVEIMLAELANISAKRMAVTPFAAIPLFARSAHNLHDHRHVTSLLQRFTLCREGVVATPTLVFDERGHRKNTVSYFVLGIDDTRLPPQHIYPTQESFTGSSGDLEAPEAVLKALPPGQGAFSQGREPMGALRFKERLLAPGQTATYIVLMGISEAKGRIRAIFNRFNTVQKVRAGLDQTKASWQEKSCSIRVRSANPAFDNWLRWVNTQPYLRRIFGCSFLPDFDYGKGGRGWRDLWQDCLQLLLNNPKEARPLLVNNFAGVRIDGSNATIVGKAPGEFIADRNNISRVWMDHGIWPWFTTELYLHQTGDMSILLEEMPYFRDQQLCRSRQVDRDWRPDEGTQLRTGSGKSYRGTVLEHILVQHLVQFFNVGAHNHILLEGADWNDGLDMAAHKGESVAFSAFYAHNLRTLAEAIARLGRSRVLLLKELTPLLDTLDRRKADYSDVAGKRRLLASYFKSVSGRVSGEKVAVETQKLADDLAAKSSWMRGHIGRNEWLKEGFFNGYYDNRGKRVEGRHNGRVRMTLTGQVFAVLSGIAAPSQIKEILRNCDRRLRDRRSGGLRLNTDFGEEQYSLGRAFSFVYGDKENGAVFSHMCVMFAYALYVRGFAREGYRVLESLYRMATDTERSRIYPCLPEYFDARGQGMYSYLTGSASWFMFTLLTQSFGIRGAFGDLLISPKLTKEQFGRKQEIEVLTTFASRRLAVRFLNPRGKDCGTYAIIKACLNGKALAAALPSTSLRLLRQDFLARAKRGGLNTIEITLD